MERENAITFKGSPLTLVGNEVSVGQPAPDFMATTNDLSSYKLSDDKGKVVVIASVPSLDTGICDKETRKFNELAASLGEDVAIVTISMDLPFAQSRWCGAAGVEQVKTVSDYKGADFGNHYGLLIKELHLLARAVLVVDQQGAIQYYQLVPEVTEEPDYDAAIEAAKKLL
ncbi:MAG: thiol peroxidase [Phycisphaerae bacterium]|nr:thiol peroxidase [Phycisphaerae bacterium]